jgi:hypothetical protein
VVLVLYAYLAQLEHREWERRFNARAARGEFVVYPEDPVPSVITALREVASELARKVSLAVATLKRWIRHAVGRAAATSSGAAE